MAAPTSAWHGLDCDSCGEALDTNSEHWILSTGRRPRLDRCGVAHDDPYADDSGACFMTLRVRWIDLAARHGAGLIHRDRPDGYWTLLGEDIHCGTPLQILTAAGVWLDGRYEISHTARGPRPVLYMALGGLNQPDSALYVSAKALLRW